MNGKKARMLRKEVYGKDFVSGAAGRTYMQGPKSHFLLADPKRHLYQNLKKLYKAGEFIPKES